MWSMTEDLHLPLRGDSEDLHLPLREEVAGVSFEFLLTHRCWLSVE